MTLQRFAHIYLFGLYDPQFPEESQCSGWRCLRQLVAEKKRPTPEQLTPIHFLLRKVIIEQWDSICSLEIE